MKIIHIEGGLGNQMACYAMYVASRECNAQDKYYFDTYIYDIKDAHSTISMWNGYELERIFNIKVDNLLTLFNQQQIEEQIDYMTKSKFWETGWNYTEHFIAMMDKFGIRVYNAFDTVGASENSQSKFKNIILRKVKQQLAKTSHNIFSFYTKRSIYKVFNMISSESSHYLWQHKKGDYYYNITLDFMKSKFLQQKIGGILRRDFTFPPLLDYNNIEMLKLIENSNSVSIHVRRTDFLEFNEECYKFGYFKRCTKFIKNKINNPVFFIFSDDSEWCENNLDVLGLDFKLDSIYFVNFNSGEESYKDMQLMSKCKHNITTKSSFGWWASFLNDNPEKITCSQMGLYNTTHKF